MSSVSSRAVRLDRYSQNAWARHVERRSTCSTKSNVSSRIETSQVEFGPMSWNLTRPKTIMTFNADVTVQNRIWHKQRRITRKPQSVTRIGLPDFQSRNTFFTLVHQASVQCSSPSVFSIKNEKRRQQTCLCSFVRCFCCVRWCSCQGTLLNLILILTYQVLKLINVRR